MSIAARALRNRRIKAFPRHEFYLVQDKSSMLRWSEPNDKWSVFSNTSGQRQVITNIQIDDTPHAPDLWLYTPLKQPEISTWKETSDEIIERNTRELDRTRNWYIRQFDEQNRPGLLRFAGVPLTAWLKMWRHPLNLEGLQLFGLSNQQTKVFYDGMEFNAFFKWPELTADFAAARSNNQFTTTDEGTRLFKTYKVLPWLQKHIQGEFRLFTDADTHFNDAEDEVCYITDVMP